MKVMKAKRKDNTVTLEVEESSEQRINEAMDKAFKTVSKNAKIPGFRKGKITRALFEKHYGKEHIIQEGLYEVINQAYKEAVDAEELKVVDMPKNVNIGEYNEGQPITFSCEVDVEPIVKLGKYKGIKVTKESDEVTEEDIEHEIKHMLEHRAEYNVTEEPIKDQDIIRFNISAKNGEELIENWSRDNAGGRVGAGQYGEDFDKALLGAKTGETKSFSIQYLDDFPTAEVAGKRIDFSVEVLEVRTKTLPELTDEIVQAATENKQQTVAEYRENVEKTLKENKEKQSEDKLRMAVIEEVVNNVKVDIPNGMTEREIDQNMMMFEQQLRQSGMDMNQYMTIAQKSMEDFREELRENAEKKVKTDLVLEAVTEKEKVEITDEDIQAEIEKWQLPNVSSIEDLKANTQFNMDSLNANLKKQKTMDLLVSLAKVKS